MLNQLGQNEVIHEGPVTDQEGANLVAAAVMPLLVATAKKHVNHHELVGHAARAVIALAQFAAGIHQDLDAAVATEVRIRRMKNVTPNRPR